MANLPWFKLYGLDYLNSPTIARLTGCERSCWVTLMCYAATRSNSIEFLDEETLLLKSGIQKDTPDWEKTQGVLQKFIKFKMITLDNEAITLLNFEKRQELSLTSYQRVKRYRDKKRDDNEMIQNDNDRVEESRVEEIRIEKSIHGEFKNVLLTPDEHGKLITKLGEKNTYLLIEELSGYLASKKVKYASHYATLLNWARRKIVEHINKPTKGKQIV